VRQGASQKILMRAALLRGESFDRMEALNRWGTAKAPARIAELRQEGLDIESVPVTIDGKRFVRWKLRDGQMKLC